MNDLPRIVFLPDTFSEVNGVAHTARHLEAFARRRQYPLLSIHAGEETVASQDGVVSVLQLKRSELRLGLDSNLDYDPILSRHLPRVMGAIRDFGGQAVHLTGPGDLGTVGIMASFLLRIPRVVSWHTNLHEYASTRLQNLLRPCGARLSSAAGRCAERTSLEILRLIYGQAVLTLAPNQELIDLTHSLTQKPCYPMRRGVDTQLFNPSHRKRVSKTFQIGYVGRLTPEKNVRLLAKLDTALRAQGHSDIEFLIVGEGSEDRWLRNNLSNARLTGVLRGQALSDAYAGMDLFVFPSFTDTFGNVVLEALASGVPCVVTNGGGPKFLVTHGLNGFVASDLNEFADYTQLLLTSADLHNQMSYEALKYAKTQSWDSVFEAVWQVYAEAIQIHARQSRRTSTALVAPSRAQSRGTN